MSISTDQLRLALSRENHVFVRGEQMRPLLEHGAPLGDWTRFAASWNGMPLDQYLALDRRFRRRRYAVYAASGSDAITRQPHQPHYQRPEYNPLFGGIAREFEPIDASIGSGGSMMAILQFCRELFGALSPQTRTWHIEAHQFRIEATGANAGHPTPEGVHRDGVDYVCVLLVCRHNMASGTTTIHTSDGGKLGSFTLTQPFDAMLLDDTRVFHGVTPVQAVDPSQPAYRDVLVVTFRRN